MRTNRIEPHVATAALFVAVLWLPIMEKQWRLIEPRALSGVEEPIKDVPLTWANWFDSSWQRSFAARQVRQASFRGHLVLTNNQLNLDLFDDVVPQLVKGSDDELFEESYHPRKAWFMGDTGAILERVRMLAKLQEYLADRSIALLVMITPSKDQHDSEFLPAAMRMAAEHPSPTQYSVVRAFLLQNKIPLLYFKEYLEQRRSTSRMRFFPQGGLHWNSYAGATAAAQLLDKISELTGKQGTRMEIIGHEMSMPRYPSDYDIARLTNVWDWRRFRSEVPYPIFAKPARRVAIGPRVLFVGGSFIFPVADTLARRRVCSKINVLYYDDTWLEYHGTVRGKKHEMDKSRRDLATLVEKFDAIVIESNEMLLTQLGYGFIEDACRALGIEAQGKPGR